MNRWFLLPGIRDKIEEVTESWERTGGGLPWSRWLRFQTQRFAHVPASLWPLALRKGEHEHDKVCLFTYVFCMLISFLHILPS